MANIDKNNKSSNQELSESSDFKQQTYTGENKNLNNSTPFHIKEEPVSPNPVKTDLMSTVPISEVKLKIKRVKLRNRELRKKNLCQETELHNYELRLLKYSKDIVDLKNEIITFKNTLEQAKKAKCILKIEICKRDFELKKFKEHVQQYIKNESEFNNRSKLLENEKRKLKKTERDLHRTTKLIETRKILIKNIKEQMKKTQSILLQLGRILNDNDNKLSSKHKKYLKTVEDEYLRNSYSDRATNDIVPKMEQDDDLQDLACAESLNLDLPLECSDKSDQETVLTEGEVKNNESCIKSQYNKHSTNIICSTSKMSSSSYVSATVPENKCIPNKGVIHPHTNLESRVLKNNKKILENIPPSPDTVFTTKNAESVGMMAVVNPHKGDTFNESQFCSTSSNTEAPTVKQEETNSTYLLIDIKEEPVSSDSDSEFFQSVVSASEVALRIQRLKVENIELKKTNTRQDCELHNYELRLSKRLTKLFEITNERNGVKEALDKTEEENCALEINLGEREAELKQFRELVQKYMRYEDDAINTSKELDDKKKNTETREKELLHATNLLKTTTATLKKIRGRRRKAHNTILQFGRILNERGIEITSKQKKYLKAIEDMHLKDTDNTDKAAEEETVVPKIENDAVDYLQDTVSNDCLIIDVSFIKQENVSDIPEENGHGT